ncbi:MAG: aldo/keto reductase [Bdellovibrionota bacterium]
MQVRPFSFTGRKIPVIGQGTWQMEQDDRRSCIESLRKGLGAGMNHVDTAELYGSGRVEEIIREALGERRKEIYLVSKVLPQNASRKGTVRACEASLKRLGTGHLDLYLLHWPGDHPLEETIAAFEELKAAGKILAWGVSNFSVEEMEEALSIAGEGKMACNQVLYHLKERAIEHHVIPWCEKHGVAVVAYSPFGSGDFPEENSPGGKVLSEIARARGATPRQVALTFLVREANVFTIPKTAHAGRAIENAKAGDIALSGEEIDRIDAAFPKGKPRPGIPYL